MQDHPDDEMTERNPGRRALDLAPLLRWLPFLSLLTVVILQTIYFTRYISGLETTNTQLVATVAEIRAEVKTLTAATNQAAVPSATMLLRIDYVEARVNELRAMANDNSRRITQLESGTRR